MKTSDDEGDSNASDVDDADSDLDSDVELSDDDLMEDDIKLKKKNLKRAEKIQSKDKGSNGLKVEAEELDSEEDDFFEDAPPFDENTTFNQMNISRPLLKVSNFEVIYHAKVRFCHVDQRVFFSFLFFFFTNCTCFSFPRLLLL